MKKLYMVLLLLLVSAIGYSQAVTGVKKSTIEGTTYVRSPKFILDRASTTTTETVKNIGGVLYWGDQPIINSGMAANEIDPFYIADTSDIAYLSQHNVLTNSNLWTGTFGSGWTESNLGGGTRMMWYPRKAAFRAGYVFSTSWNDANIGDYSAAFNTSTTASGTASAAFGSSTSSGYLSFATGTGTIASGTSSTTAGGGTKASGGYGFAANWNTLASGDGTAAFGNQTLAKSRYTFAIGQWNVGGGDSLANMTLTDPAFQIGNGTNASNRSNAFEVLKGGNTIVSGNLTVKGSTNDASPDSLASFVNGEIKRTSSRLLATLRTSSVQKDSVRIADEILFWRGDAGGVPDTLVIPLASKATGKKYIIQKPVVTEEGRIVSSGGNLIYSKGGNVGGDSFVIPINYAYNIELVSDGSNWFMIREEIFDLTP